MDVWVDEVDDVGEESMRDMKEKVVIDVSSHNRSVSIWYVPIAITILLCH